MSLQQAVNATLDMASKTDDKRLLQSYVNVVFASIPKVPTRNAEFELNTCGKKVDSWVTQLEKRPPKWLSKGRKLDTRRQKGLIQMGKEICKAISAELVKRQEEYQAQHDMHEMPLLKAIIKTTKLACESDDKQLLENSMNIVVTEIEAVPRTEEGSRGLNSCSEQVNSWMGQLPKSDKRLFKVGQHICATIGAELDKRKRHQARYGGGHTHGSRMDREEEMRDVRDVRGESAAGRFSGPSRGGKSAQKMRDQSELADQHLFLEQSRDTIKTCKSFAYTVMDRKADPALLEMRNMAAATQIRLLKSSVEGLDPKKRDAMVDMAMGLVDEWKEEMDRKRIDPASEGGRCMKTFMGAVETTLVAPEKVSEMPDWKLFDHEMTQSAVSGAMGVHLGSIHAIDGQLKDVEARKAAYAQHHEQLRKKGQARPKKRERYDHIPKGALFTHVRGDRMKKPANGPLDGDFDDRKEGMNQGGGYGEWS